MPGFFDYLEQPPVPGLLQYAGASSDPLMAAMAAQRLPPLDELLRSGAGQPAPFYPSAQNWGLGRDPFVFGAPRQQPAGDVVLPSGAPSFVDTTPRVGKSLHRGDAGMYQLLPVAGRQSPDPAGLPEAVRRSIQEQPSYGEGQVMAPQQWWNSAMGGPLQQLGPQRENYLQFDRRQALGLDNPDTVNPWFGAMPEGGMWSSRPAGVSPFARHPQYPFALY